MYAISDYPRIRNGAITATVGRVECAFSCMQDSAMSKSVPWIRVYDGNRGEMGQYLRKFNFSCCLTEADVHTRTMNGQSMGHIRHVTPGK